MLVDQVKHTCHAPILRAVVSAAPRYVGPIRLALAYWLETKSLPPISRSISAEEGCQSGSLLYWWMGDDSLGRQETSLPHLPLCCLCGACRNTAPHSLETKLESKRDDAS